jgi:UDP-GlcNAc:undecaprenyl-phosphate/decaprenyl-phosphate GlcNAc-1-phosphate transferase
LFPLLFTSVAIILNLIMTPLIIMLSIKHKWFDPIDTRKIHTGNIPRLGGVGIFWATFLVSILGFLVSHLKGKALVNPRIICLLAGMLVIHVMSLIDDFKDLPARFRLVVQVIVALFLAFWNFRFHAVWLPGLGVLTFPFWFSVALTVIWVVGMINAVNMIDGMDGLCGGIAAIITCVYAILYLIQAETLPAILAFAAVGALLGFLFFNFPPAKIFMGDSGSTFLGFLIAYLPIMGSSPVHIDVDLYVGASLALIPIYDAFAAVLRRLKGRQPIMAPDKWHLHHKLLALGFDVRSILAIVYGACFSFGLIGISSQYLPRPIFFGLAVAEWVIGLGAFIVLHYQKERMVNVEKDS